MEIEHKKIEIYVKPEGGYTICWKDEAPPETFADVDYAALTNIGGGLLGLIEYLIKYLKEDTELKEAEEEAEDGKKAE